MERGLKAWEPSTLSAKHKHVISMSAVGLKNREISKLIGLSESRISVILNDPRAQRLKQEMVASSIQNIVETAGEKIRALQAEAVDTVAQVMRHAERDADRFRAASDLLDRGGNPKRSEQAVIPSTEIDSKDAARLLEAFRESQREPEEIEMVEDSNRVFKSVTDPFDQGDDA